MRVRAKFFDELVLDKTSLRSLPKKKSTPSIFSIYLARSRGSLLRLEDFRVGFDYRYPVRHPVPVSPGTVIPLPTPSTRYRHPVLDDGIGLKGGTGYGTGWIRYRSGTG